MADNIGDYLIIPKADQILDCSGLLGPLPVIKTCRAIKQIEIGQTLQVITTDQGSPLDMVAWARLTGHELIDACQESGKFIFYVQRNK